MMKLMGWTMRTPTPVPTVKTQSNVSVLIPSVQQVDPIQVLYDNAKRNYPTTSTSDAFTKKTQSFYPICKSTTILCGVDIINNILVHISITYDGVYENTCILNLDIYQLKLPFHIPHTDFARDILGQSTNIADFSVKL